MSSPLLGPAEIRALAAQLGLRPTKTLGQNFVHDANTIRRIVATADLVPGEQVLEVGPGLGSLTLAQGRAVESERYYRQAVTLQEKLVLDFPREPAHRKDLAAGHHGLGQVLLQTGRLDQAQVTLRA